MLSCLLLTLQSPLLVTCSVCVESQSQTALGTQPLETRHCAVGLPAREDTHQEGAWRAFLGENKCQTVLQLGFYVPCQKEGESCPFCPLKIMLDLPGYFKIKLNLLHRILEMHFKYLFKEDSCILGIQKRREYYFQRV